MAPSIDKGQAGSKTVRAGRTAFWQIRCKGEPPPVFTWVHPVHGNLSSCEAFTVMTEEYQGGATTTLVIHHAEDSDRGTYTLKAENRFPFVKIAENSFCFPLRNGSEKVDLDLIVLDKDHHDCDMYARGNKQCSCTHSYTG